MESLRDDPDGAAVSSSISASSISASSISVSSQRTLSEATYLHPATDAFKPGERARWPRIVKSAALVVTILLGALAVQTRNQVDPEAVLTVSPRAFAIELEASGVVEPRHSERVTSECDWNTRILSLVPEGTYVQKGDVVCVLDSSLLEDYRTIRELRLIRARTELDAAVQHELLTQAANERRRSEAEFQRQAAVGRLEEYELGTYPQEVERGDADVRLRESQLLAAQQEFQNIEEMWALGFVSRQALEAAGQDLTAKKEGFRRARAGGILFARFEHPRSELELGFAVRHAERDVMHSEALASLAETQARMERIANERQARILADRLTAMKNNIAACTVRAPRDGQIIFANSLEDLGRGRRTIEEGKSVYFRQPLFEIADDSQRVVQVPVPEALITRICIGMPVVARMVGYEAERISGEILEIPRYSKSRSDFSLDSRDYWVTIRLTPTVEQQRLIRLRMDARVTFELSRRADALAIPREAIVGRAGFSCVWLRQGQNWTPRAVAVGEIDSQRACISAGLESGDQIAVQLSPAQRTALQSHVDDVLRQRQCN